MTVFSNSRYANQPIVMLPNADGSYSPAIFRGVSPLPTTFFHYVLQQGDRFDILAYNFYSDATLSWMIADANPEIIFPGGILTPGQTIRIPNG